MIMSLRRKIGQMLIMGFSGCELDETSPVVSWLQGDGLGGVLLFDFDFTKKSYGKNLKTQDQIKHLTQQLNRYAATSNSEGTQPLFIAIDYEGGAVDRLSKIAGCMTTMKPCEQALLSENSLQQEAKRMAETLHSLGFNLNFSPVVDLNLNQQQGIIGRLGRSFSADPKEVIRVSKQIVSVFHQYGITCAYKHFPGHGSAKGDTHEGFVDVTDHYQPIELVPYTGLLNDETLPPAMVMTAHVINRQLDASGLPATLSYLIITQLLRREMGFDGLVISDDLQMQAISDHYSLEDALQLTINAGADMVIFGNQLGHHTAPELIDCIEQLVKSGKIPMARIEEAYQRIVKLKQASLH
jgi:beta-N-acetylhexosaminidase